MIYDSDQYASHWNAFLFFFSILGGGGGGAEIGHKTSKGSGSGLHIDKHL